MLKIIVQQELNYQASKVHNVTVMNWQSMNIS